MYALPISLIILQNEDVQLSSTSSSFFFFYFQIWFLNNLNRLCQRLQQLFRFYLLQVHLSFIFFIFCNTYHVFVVWKVLIHGWLWLGIQGCLTVAYYPWLTLKFQIWEFVLELAAWKRILVSTLSFCFGVEIKHKIFFGFFFFFFLKDPHVEKL